MLCVCSDHEGKVDCMPMLLTAVSLSKGKLEEKYKGMWNLIMYE